jgi:G:T-mismatch repair DNA endonuclease (very short patch repair protein)
MTHREPRVNDVLVFEYLNNGIQYRSVGMLEGGGDIVMPEYYIWIFGHGNASLVKHEEPHRETIIKLHGLCQT